MYKLAKDVVRSLYDLSIESGANQKDAEGFVAELILRIATNQAMDRFKGNTGFDSRYFEDYPRLGSCPHETRMGRNGEKKER